MLLPTIYAVSAAFKPLDEIYIFPPRLFVRRPTLDNFVQVGVLADTFWVPLSKYGGVSACEAQLCGEKSFFKYC